MLSQNYLYHLYKLLKQYLSSMFTLNLTFATVFDPEFYYWLEETTRRLPYHATRWGGQLIASLCLKYDIFNA